jgi:CRISPR/Cas system CMR-associated protein Cmr1 (group 7 of RAMP superfamily)
VFLLPVRPEVWSIKEQFPCYFGNMGDPKPGDVKQEKHLSFSSETLKLQFQSKHQILLKILNKNIASFLTANNFGSRQSKGFGCFYIENSHDFENTLKENFAIIYKKDLFMNASNMGYSYFFSVFKEIEKEYKLLKAGDAGQKKESKLRDYFNSLNPTVEWEKPLMQKMVSEITGAKMNIKNYSSNHQYVRAVLGLAETFEYPKFGKLKFGVTHIPEKSPQLKDEKIERFQSPITFKFYKGAIYLCCNEFTDSQKKIFNKEFEFKPSRGSDKIILKTPSQIEFSLLNFVDSLNLESRKWIHLK